MMPRQVIFCTELSTKTIVCCSQYIYARDHSQSMSERTFSSGHFRSMGGGGKKYQKSKCPTDVNCECSKESRPKNVKSKQQVIGLSRTQSVLRCHAIPIDTTAGASSPLGNTAGSRRKEISQNSNNPTIAI